MAAAMKHMALSFAKLEKFKGVDFRRWQKKMHFMLSSMSVVYVLTTPMPEDGGENPTVEQIKKRAKWDNDDYVCRGLILNDMSDSLFDIYQNVETSKELWDTLETKYMPEDTSSKKFLDDDVTWRVDSGAAVHVCKDRCLFKTYESLNDGSILYMEMSQQPLCMLNIVSDNIGLAFMSTFKLNDSILWHARLGHVYFKRMQDMWLISAIDMDTKKCKTCMLNKITKKPFQDVKRVTKVLELIHNDLCDLHATPSLGNKKVAVWLPDPKLKNLDEKGIECIFVGYAEHSKAFRSLVKGTKDSGGLVVSKRVTDEIVQQSEPELRKRKRHRTPKDFGLEYQLYLIEGTRDEVSDQHSYCFNVEDDPKIFDEAIKSHDVAFRKKAINDAMDSIMGNNTWVLTDLPQMDVKTNFLNGKLEEKAPKQWHQKFNEVVLSNGYLLNQADKCVYSKFDASGRSDQEIFIIKALYERHEGGRCYPCTPIHTCEKLMPNRGLAVSQLEYSRVIGCLMYAMTCTRPDIAFILEKLSRYTSNPGTQHWQAIQRVLKYLKKTMDYRLVYFGYPSVLEGYTDASWISNTKDNSFTSGWVFLLGGATGEEAEWLKNFLLEIPLWVKPIAPISIRCDSAATLAKAYSQMYNGKSRHLGVKHSMIRELIINGAVSIEFRAEAHVLQIIPRMCLKPTSKEDEVANFSMVNFFEKVLSRSMNKEEPPIEAAMLIHYVTLINIPMIYDIYIMIEGDLRFLQAVAKAHSGLVEDEAWKLFNSIANEHGDQPLLNIQGYILCSPLTDKFMDFNPRVEFAHRMALISDDIYKLRWPPSVTLRRLLPHARGLGFKPRRGGFPSGAKKKWGLSLRRSKPAVHSLEVEIDGVGEEGRGENGVALQLPEVQRCARDA
nr:hypothetical protein [Tanacetum cinerariifolium]